MKFFLRALRRTMMIGFAALCCTLFIFAADAETVVKKKLPTAASAEYIAILFYKLADKIPNFDEWAVLTKEFADADVYDHNFVRENQKTRMRDVYSSLGKSEPVVVQTYVELSAFDPAQKQFVINSLIPSTFFPYSFARRNYAIVPLGIEETRIIRSGAGDTALLEQNAGEPRKFLLVLSIRPMLPRRAADFPVTIGNKAYFILTGNTINRALYDIKGAKLIWEEHPGQHWGGQAAGGDEKNLELELQLAPQ